MKQITKKKAKKIIDNAEWINKDVQGDIVTLIIKEKK